MTPGSGPGRGVSSSKKRVRSGAYPLLLSCVLGLQPACNIVLEGDPATDAAPLLDATVVDAAPPEDAEVEQPDAFCLPVPALVRFEDVPVGEVSAAAVPLGCGRGLALQAARLVQVDPPDAFTLPDGLPGAPVDHLRITYRPRRVAEQASAVLVLTTSAGEYTVPVAGSARFTDAACRHWGVEALGTGIEGLLRLEATPPAGVAPTAAQVQWSVVERPNPSVTQPTEDFRAGDPASGAPDDPATPSAWFFMDFAGLYTFECVVKLPADSGCPTQQTRITVQACPCPDDLRVRLTWTVEGGEALADLDLHLLHPEAAAWEAPGLDCSPADMDPRWIAAANALERPTHSGDDQTAPGFERIELPRAQGEDVLPGPYRVAVVNRAAVPVEATLQVFLSERMVWTHTRPLTPADGMWDAAAIGWHRGALVAAVLDRVLPAGPLPDPWAPLPAASACLPEQAPTCAEGYTCRDDDGALVGHCRR